MSSLPPRHLHTVTGAGGPGVDVYDQAVDPLRPTIQRALTITARAEAARIDALFSADLLRFGAQGAIGSQEPLIFLAALRAVTSHIGLIATVSSTFYHPNNLARLFGTVDHVSNGRAAWNLVTSSMGEENYGVPLPAPEKRYARAAEHTGSFRCRFSSSQGLLALGVVLSRVRQPPQHRRRAGRSRW